MKKKERTQDERYIDRINKRAIMSPWSAQPSHEAEPSNPFPYVLYWDKLERKGQRCRILKSGPRVFLVEFADGFRHTINRLAIRRM